MEEEGDAYMFCILRDFWEGVDVDADLHPKEVSAPNEPSQVVQDVWLQTGNEIPFKSMQSHASTSSPCTLDSTASESPSLLEIGTRGTHCLDEEGDPIKCNDDKEEDLFANIQTISNDLREQTQYRPAKTTTSHFTDSSLISPIASTSNAKSRQLSVVPVIAPVKRKRGRPPKLDKNSMSPDEYQVKKKLRDDEKKAKNNESARQYRAKMKKQQMQDQEVADSQLNDVRQHNLGLKMREQFIIDQREYYLIKLGRTFGYSNEMLNFSAMQELLTDEYCQIRSFIKQYPSATDYFGKSK